MALPCFQRCYRRACRAAARSGLIISFVIIFAPVGQRADSQVGPTANHQAGTGKEGASRALSAMPSPHHSQDVERDNPGGANKGRTPKDRWRITDAVQAISAAVSAIATVALAGFAAVQIRIYQRQTRVMDLTFKASRRATRAAVRSAVAAERALTELERPYIVVDMTESQGIDARTAAFGGRRLLDPLHYRLVNHGRTAAILREFCGTVRVVPKDVLPMAVDPEKTRGSPLPAGLVIPKDGARHQERLLIPDILGSGPTPEWERLEKILTGEDRIYFMGFISYSDVFDLPQISGFCSVLIEDRWLIAGGDLYNYNKSDKRLPAPSGVSPA
jgi:hypothetical protein